MRGTDIKSGLLAIMLPVMLLIPACAQTPPEQSPQVLASAAEEDVQERPVLKRKNIDELTAEELAAYEHAVAMMKRKSEQNPFDQTGFTWQAWVHNCPFTWVTNDRQLDPAHEDLNRQCLFAQGDRGLPMDHYHGEYPGMCEHAKDIFLQWHRAEFYFYEQSLQRADPEGKFGPSTKNVTVPYWNFTQPPSGMRYPKAFEDKSSPLYHENRRHDAITTPYAFTSPHLLAYQIYFMDWPSFGGYPPTGEGNYGAFEAMIHNPMHATYVGGDMASPSTAAYDPVFFSFHSFIDFIYEAWIDEHGPEGITSQREFMRAFQDPSIPKPPGFVQGDGLPNMGRAEIYRDTRVLGYEFDPGQEPPFLPKGDIARLIAESETAGSAFGESEMSFFARLQAGGAHEPSASPGAVLEGQLGMPSSLPSGAGFLINIVRNAGETDFSFQADVYFHPEGVEADISNRDFRLRYLAVTTAYWALGRAHAHHGGDLLGHDMGVSKTRLTNDVTQTVRSMQRGRGATDDWQITVAITPKGDVSPFDFATPTLVTVPRRR